MASVEAVEGKSADTLICIGDLHGCLEETLSLWENLAKYLGSQEALARATVVFLGDYVDRGPDTKGVLDWLIHLREKRRSETQTGGTYFIAGNHDFAMGAFLACAPFDSTALEVSTSDLDATTPTQKYAFQEIYESGESGDDEPSESQTKTREGMHYQGRRWGGSCVYDADATWASYLKSPESSVTPPVLSPNHVTGGRKLHGARVYKQGAEPESADGLAGAGHATSELVVASSTEPLASSESDGGSVNVGGEASREEVPSDPRERRKRLLERVPASHKAFIQGLAWCVDLHTPFEPGRLLAVHAGLDPTKSAEAQVAALKRRDFRAPILIDKEPGRLEVLSGRNNVRAMHPELVGSTILVSGHHHKVEMRGDRVILDNAGGEPPFSSPLQAMLFPSREIVSSSCSPPPPPRDLAAEAKQRAETKAAIAKYKAEKAEKARALKLQKEKQAAEVEK